MYFWKFFKDQQSLYISKILTTTKKMLLGVWFNFCPGKRKLLVMFTFCFLQNQIKTKIWQLISSLVSQFSVQNLSFLLIWKKNLNFANNSRFFAQKLNWVISGLRNILSRPGLGRFARGERTRRLAIRRLLGEGQGLDFEERIVQFVQ